MARLPLPAQTAVMKAGPQGRAPREGGGPMVLEYLSPSATLIARPVPLGSRYTGWTVAVMIIALLATLTLLPVDRVVVTRGKVAAVTGNLMVQPLELSLVRTIDVKEGQIVKAGDVLAELDPTFAAADAGALEKQVASLQAQVDRINAELAGRPYLSDGTPAGQLQAVAYAQRHAERAFKQEDYAQKIASLQVQVDQSKSDVATYTERRKLASVIEGKRRELERLQVGSQLNSLQATDSRVDIEAKLAMARSQGESAHRQLDATVADRDREMQQWLTDTSKDLTDQGRLLADASEQLRKATLRRDLVRLRAGHDAIVLRVAPVSPGTVMQPGQEFITLVPLDAPLEIDAVLAGEDVGFVRVGDPVTIKFETFPYGLYGTGTGTVRAISPDSFRDPQAPPQTDTKTRTASAMGELFFRAKMSIDEIRLHDLPAGARIVPGMPVQADIKVGERTVMRYLMSRLVPATSEGMREP